MIERRLSRIGQRFKVVGMDAIIEVVGVEGDRSMAIVKEGDGDIQQGVRVEAATGDQRSVGIGG